MRRRVACPSTSRYTRQCRNYSNSSPSSSRPTRPSHVAMPKTSGEAGLAVAERVRSLIALRKSGTFTTINAKATEGPESLLAATLSYMLDDQGLPVVAIRKDSQHFQHLSDYPRGSLVIFSLVPPGFNPAKVPVPRMMIAGSCATLSFTDETRKRFEKEFLVHHPKAEALMKDLDFVSIQATDIAYHTGSDTHFIERAEYDKAKVDPIVRDSRPLLEMMNSEHAAVLPRFCEEYGGAKNVDPVLMYNIDRFGFNMLAVTPGDQGWTDHRFPFPFEMHTAEEVKTALLENIEKLSSKKSSKPAAAPPPSSSSSPPQLLRDNKW